MSDTPRGLAVIVALLLAGSLASHCTRNEATTTASSPRARVLGAPIAYQRPPNFASGFLRRDGKRNIIVFVHGVLGDSTSTWTNDNGAYWPQMIRADGAFDDADIYVFGYPSPLLRRAFDIDEIARALRLELKTNGVLDYERIIFVCHSMGGLVTRDLLLHLRPKPSQVPLTVFYSTPTAGAEIAKLAQYLSRNPQFKYMIPHEENEYVRLIESFWQGTNDDIALSYGKNIESYCAYEKQVTDGVLIVDQLSATHLCLHQQPINASHITIVKPASLDDAQGPHAFLREAYKQLAHTPPAIAEKTGMRTAREEVSAAINRYLFATKVLTGFFAQDFTAKVYLEPSARDYNEAIDDLAKRKTALRGLVREQWGRPCVRMFERVNESVEGMDEQVHLLNIEIGPVLAGKKEKGDPAATKDIVKSLQSTLKAVSADAERLYNCFDQPTSADAVELTAFPQYVTKLASCISRGDVCLGQQIQLGGVTHTQGVIYTQPGAVTNGHSEAKFLIPDGATQLLFTVGNYYHGADCTGKAPVRVAVEIDGQQVWPPPGQVTSVADVQSKTIDLHPGTRLVTLVGNTGDGPVDCDDAAWGSVRFDDK